MGNVSAFLVAIGVVGEFMKDFLSGPYEEVVEKARQAEIAEITARAAKANERAAEANEKAEQEQLARVKLEALIQPRRLTLEQESILRLKASSFAGTRVIFKVYDAEGWALAKQLGTALKDWDAENIAWIIPGDIVDFGVVV
jgi:hypothetical protein